MYKNSILKNSFWLVSSSVFNRIQGFFMIVFLARLISPFELGLYNIIQNLINRGDIVGRFGTDLAIHRSGAQINIKGPIKTGRLFGVGTTLNIISGFLITAILIINKDLVANYWLREPSTSKWIVLAAISIFITLVGNCPWFFLLALKEFKKHSVNLTLYISFKAFLCLILTFSYGYRGALVSILVSQLFYFFQGYFLAKNTLKIRSIKLRFNNFLSESINIFKFGLPFYISNFVENIIDIPFMLYVTRIGGLSELGYLRIAQTLGQFVNFFSQAFSPMVITYLSESNAVDNQKSEYLKSIHFRLVGGITIYIGLLCQILVSFLVPTIFGEAYIKAIILSRIELLIGFILAINSILTQYLVSYGKTLSIALTNTFSLPIKIILSLVLIPQYSSIGLLSANLSYYFFNFLIYLWLAFKSSSRKDKKYLVKFLIFFIVSNSMVLIINNLNLTYLHEASLNILIGLISFISYLKLMMDKDELNLIKSYSHKVTTRYINSKKGIFK